MKMTIDFTDIEVGDTILDTPYGEFTVARVNWLAFSRVPDKPDAAVRNAEGQRLKWLGDTRVEIRRPA